MAKLTLKKYPFILEVWRSIDCHYKNWLWTGIIAASIFIAGHFSALFASIHDVTPVWPASGIALAALLLLGGRARLGILLGFICTDIYIYHNLFIGTLLGLGETSEALIAAFLVHRLNRHRYIFEHVQSVLYLLLAAIASPLANASFGTTVLYLNQKLPGEAFLEAWKTWWIADTVGILIFTPALLVWLKRSAGTLHLTRRNIPELIFLISITVLATYEVFINEYPLEYLFLLLIIWAAFRFGSQLTTLLLVGLSMLSILATAQGLGTFTETSRNASLVFLQSFVGTLAITALILSAIVREQKKGAAELTLANETLECRVEARTAELSETLAELRRTQAQLVQTEKMSSLGQLVAGIAHEINNPINFIYGNVAPAKAYTEDLFQLLALYEAAYPNPTAAIQDHQEAIDLAFLKEDLFKLLDSMKVGCQRVREIVKSLRNFSRLDESEFKTVDIHEGIESTLMIVQNQLKAKPNFPGIQVIKDYTQLPLVECYPGELNQVLMNIVTNAIDVLVSKVKAGQKAADSIETGLVCPLFSPMITIQTRKIDPKWIAISITDNGSGFDEAVRSKLFDPFFTTKPVGDGTGLGLSISYQIITQSHGGKLWCHSVPEQGAKFVIEIPIKQQSK